MTLKEQIAKAIDNQDAMLAGRIVEELRAVGFTYTMVFDAVQKVCPAVSLEDWDALLYEADMQESTNG